MHWEFQAKVGWKVFVDQICSEFSPLLPQILSLGILGAAWRSGAFPGKSGEKKSWSSQPFLADPALLFPATGTTPGVTP